MEVHPFVHWVARVKCFWEFDMKRLHRKLVELLAYVRSPSAGDLHQHDLTGIPRIIAQMLLRAKPSETQTPPGDYQRF